MWKLAGFGQRSLPHSHFSHRKPAHSCHVDTRLQWFPCVFSLYPASSRFTSFFWLAKEASPLTPSRCLIWDQTIQLSFFQVALVSTNDALRAFPSLSWDGDRRAPLSLESRITWPWLSHKDNYSGRALFPISFSLYRLEWWWWLWRRWFHSSPKEAQHSPTPT